ncbi:MAG: cyclic lactone autoinducer peptide [Marinisporobacter sp.]|jgi:cyclic lactone autoinducer peptide|nr:cyclic lactone autoinducer peptide [Marinisporobacter sp.]
MKKWVVVLSTAIVTLIAGVVNAGACSSGAYEDEIPNCLK